MKKRKMKPINVKQYSIFKTILYIISIVFSFCLLIVSFFDGENGIPFRVISIITLFFGSLSFLLFVKRKHIFFVSTALKYAYVFNLVVEVVFVFDILAMKFESVRIVVVVVAIILFLMWGLFNILFPERVYYKDFWGKTHWK